MSSVSNTPARSVRGIVGRIDRWTVGIGAATMLFLVVMSLTVPNFGTARNFGFLVIDLVPVLLLALALCFVVVTGEIDLSIASTVALTGALAGRMWEAGLPFEAIAVVAVIAGAVLGTFNGVLVALLGLPSLAVTIATLALYRGLTYVTLGDTAITGFPRQFSGWVLGSFPGTSIPNILIPLILVIALFAVVLGGTVFGRDVFAVGANIEAARYSGVRTRMTKLIVFVMSGATAGLVGVFWILRYSTARADNAYGLELTVVAAVVLGGVSIYGGSGTILGVLSGVVLLGGLQNALRLLGVSADALTALTGVLLVLAVLVPNVIGRIRARRRPRQQVSLQ